jgi:hypothetical protein
MFSIDSNVVLVGLRKKKENKQTKISHSTCDLKINMIYFIPFAWWENGLDSIGIKPTRLKEWWKGMQHGVMI